MLFLGIRRGFFVFFFQAEDGIRDDLVTGVQTCALPISHTVCYEILREILRESRAFQAKEFRVLASQLVIDLFLEEESASVAMLSDFIGKPVSLQVESSYTQEQFDIVLM